MSLTGGWQRPKTLLILLSMKLMLINIVLNEVEVDLNIVLNEVEVD